MLALLETHGTAGSTKQDRRNCCSSVICDTLQSAVDAAVVVVSGPVRVGPDKSYSIPNMAIRVQVISRTSTGREGCLKDGNWGESCERDRLTSRVGSLGRA